MADAILADVDSSGIYQIRNLVNGKRYIGSAVNMAARWRQHKCEANAGRHNQIFQNAWNKYGESSFVFEAIETVPDRALLIPREQHYIDTISPEYNVTKTAGSNLGMRWSKETISRMSAANKAVWSRPGHREKMSAAHKGQIRSEESRAKSSEKLRGRKLSPSHAATVAAQNADRNRSPEHRARISAYWKGRPKTAEQNQKIADSKRGKPAHNRGKPMSEEQKAKQSAAMKAKYASDPEFRKKISETTRAAMSRLKNQSSPA